MRKNNQGGFTLIESILVIVVAIVLVFSVYYFGWGTRGQAGERALAGDVQTIEKVVGAYILSSNGLYPTDDGKRPGSGEHKLIIWDASFTASGKQLSFYPDFIEKLPRHWNEGAWRIDNLGRVSVTINSEDY